jgi:hypothetical protein
MFRHPDLEPLAPEEEPNKPWLSILKDGFWVRILKNMNFSNLLLIHIILFYQNIFMMELI